MTTSAEPTRHTRRLRRQSAVLRCCGAACLGFTPAVLVPLNQHHTPLYGVLLTSFGLAAVGCLLGERASALRRRAADGAAPAKATKPSPNSSVAGTDV